MFDFNFNTSLASAAVFHLHHGHQWCPY